MSENSPWEQLKILLQQIIPQHLLSGWMFTLARCRWQALKNLLIRYVIHRYRIDMSIAANPDYRSYASFNDFFTRGLNAGARPITGTDDTVVSPVDGTISQIGGINLDQIIQAKGRQYDLPGLLAGDEQLADRFRNGSFVTLYLSPRDYHRVHMPIDGKLQQMLYVPGRLFSVNPATTRRIPQLFSRNERVISIFQTRSGLVAVILVGAIFVGSMETVWAGQITPAPNRELRRWSYPESGAEVKLAKGAEMGRFNMGSTVILLFEQDRIEWLEDIRAGAGVVMGQAIGKLLATSY